jgi:hypothetical protein
MGRARLQPFRKTPTMPGFKPLRGVTLRNPLGQESTDFFGGHGAVFREIVSGLLFVVDVDFCQALDGFCQLAENVKISNRRGRRVRRVFFGFVIPSGARDLQFFSARRSCRSLASFGMTIIGGGSGSEGDAWEFAAEVGGVSQIRLTRI